MPYEMKWNEGLDFSFVPSSYEQTFTVELDLDWSDFESYNLSGNAFSGIDGFVQGKYEELIVSVFQEDLSSNYNLDSFSIGSGINLGAESLPSASIKIYSDFDVYFDSSDPQYYEPSAVSSLESWLSIRPDELFSIIAPLDDVFMDVSLSGIDILNDHTAPIAIYIDFSDVYYDLELEGQLSEKSELSFDTSDLQLIFSDLSYQWYRDGQLIPDTNQKTYTLTQKDVGTVINAKINFSDFYETSGAIFSYNTSEVLNVNDLPSGTISILGEAAVGAELNVVLSDISDLDGIENAVFLYQWYYDDKTINGATDNSFTIGNEFEGSQISVKVKFSDGQGTTETLTSESTDIITSDIKSDIIPALHYRSENGEPTFSNFEELLVEYSSGAIIKYDYSETIGDFHLNSLNVDDLDFIFQGEKIPTSFFDDVSSKPIEITRYNYEDGSFADVLELQLQGIIPAFEVSYSTSKKVTAPDYNLGLNYDNLLTISDVSSLSPSYAWLVTGSEEYQVQTFLQTALPDWLSFYADTNSTFNSGLLFANKMPEPGIYDVRLSTIFGNLDPYQISQVPVGVFNDEHLFQINVEKIEDVEGLSLILNYSTSEVTISDIYENDYERILPQDLRVYGGSEFSLLSEAGIPFNWGEWGGLEASFPDFSNREGQTTSYVSNYSTFDTSNPILEIFNSQAARLALMSDGSAVTWGSAWDGADINGIFSEMSNDIVDILNFEQGFAALKSDGTVLEWGTYWFGGSDIWVFEAPSKIIDFVHRGNDDFFALSEGGILYTSNSETSQLDFVTSGVSKIIRPLNYGVLFEKNDGSFEGYSHSTKEFFQTSDVFSQDLIKSEGLGYALLADNSLLDITTGLPDSKLPQGLRSDVADFNSSHGWDSEGNRNYELEYILKTDGTLFSFGTTDSADNYQVIEISEGIKEVFSSWHFDGFLALNEDKELVIYNTIDGSASVIDPLLSSNVEGIFELPHGDFAGIKSDGTFFHINFDYRSSEPLVRFLSSDEGAKQTYSIEHLWGTDGSGENNLNQQKIEFKASPEQALEALDFLLTGNIMPEILSLPSAGSVNNNQFSYQFIAEDTAFGDDLIYFARDLPEWLTFDTNTGILSGDITDADLGIYDVTLVAQLDDHDIVTPAVQKFEIQVDKHGLEFGELSSLFGDTTNEMKNAAIGDLVLKVKPTLEHFITSDDQLYFSENGHVYSYIDGAYTWHEALDAASSLVLGDVTGHLATITSFEEQNFIKESFLGTGDAWIAASDAEQEGEWFWMAGPEEGTQFWSGAGAQGLNGTAGLAVEDNYNNWRAGRYDAPNERPTAPDQDAAHLMLSTSVHGQATWEDTHSYIEEGYILEFSPLNRPHEFIITADTSNISDLDGLGVFSYQWLKNGAVIDGANQTEFLVTASAAEAEISFEVFFWDGLGNFETISSQKAAFLKPDGTLDFVDNSYLATEEFEENSITETAIPATEWYGPGNDIPVQKLLTQVLSVGSNEYEILGSSGDDVLYGANANDTLIGGFGNDTLAGGAGNDVIDGGDGDDTIEGGDGDDTLDGGIGINYSNGGSGNDTIILEGNGTFSSDLVALNISSSLQIGTNERINLTGKTRFEDVMDGGADIDTVELTHASDAFFLHDSFSSFHSSLELINDFDDGAGTARIENIENINAGGGDDIIDLTSPDYSLSGQNITVEGGEGNDTLWGSDANETLHGGDGNDEIFGGAGMNELIGGSGADEFQFTRTSNKDTISDFDIIEGDTLKFFNTGEVQFDRDSVSLNSTGDELSIAYGADANDMMMITLTNAGLQLGDLTSDVLIIM